MNVCCNVCDGLAIDQPEAVHPVTSAWLSLDDVSLPPPPVCVWVAASSYLSVLFFHSDQIMDQVTRVDCRCSTMYSIEYSRQTFMFLHN